LRLNKKYKIIILTNHRHLILHNFHDVITLRYKIISEYEHLQSGQFLYNFLKLLIQFLHIHICLQGTNIHEDNYIQHITHSNIYLFLLLLFYCYSAILINY
jgi:hypothetical protein